MTGGEVYGSLVDGGTMQFAPDQDRKTLKAADDWFRNGDKQVSGLGMRAQVRRHIRHLAENRWRVWRKTYTGKAVRFMKTKVAKTQPQFADDLSQCPINQSLRPPGKCGRPDWCVLRLGQRRRD